MCNISKCLISKAMTLKINVFLQYITGTAVVKLRGYI